LGSGEALEVLRNMDLSLEHTSQLLIDLADEHGGVMVKEGKLESHTLEYKVSHQPCQWNTIPRPYRAQLERVPPNWILLKRLDVYFLERSLERFQAEYLWWMAIFKDLK
jgi:hypothetical protein